MKIVTPEQMKEIDMQAISNIGIPGIVLMENAAIKVAEEVERTLGSVENKNIIFFAGKGNNGGDAFAAVRHLVNKGAKPKVFIVTEKKLINGDAKLNLNIIEKMGIGVTELLHESQLHAVLSELEASDLVVDGILGTGINGNIKGLIKQVIEIINNAAKRIISIDIPSGINGETGKVLGICIKADTTVTFGLPKIGLIVHPGCEFTGRLIVADISLPTAVIDGLDIKTNLTDESYVSKLIPVRRSESNKGDYGKVFIICGSVGMTGAGTLSGGAALRVGAGLVSLGVPSSLTSIYDILLPEAVTIPLEDNGSGYLSKDSINKVLNQMKNKTVAAIGPGLSVNDDIIDLVYHIIENSNIPIVVDADALNSISKDTSILKKLKSEAVLTPHPFEMARMVGISIEDVQNNRIEVAREFACKWKVTLVLKGSKTIVAAPDGRVFINPTGNSGMATGGTGDVLTGVIAGLIGQGVKPFDAAVAGVYIHGLAGDSAAAVKGEHGIIAGDLVNELPFVVKKLTK